MTTSHSESIEISVVTFLMNVVFISLFSIKDIFPLCSNKYLKLLLCNEPEVFMRVTSCPFKDISAATAHPPFPAPNTAIFTDFNLPERYILYHIFVLNLLYIKKKCF